MKLVSLLILFFLISSINSQYLYSNPYFSQASEYYSQSGYQPQYSPYYQQQLQYPSSYYGWGTIKKY
ncbi:unnamed protein product [Caenorhabditis angaria]|uniref:Uncharacterized protein n=1 Tax=Caenorhabditis angaria TaxID=860376 RepID=A0A9P1N226_9PELO|nr:unnamed protein product [Caenorhabditis angaria]